MVLINWIYYLFSKFFKKPAKLKQIGSNIVIPVVILDLNPVNSLIVYALQTKEQWKSKNYQFDNKVYWKDSKNEEGCGPFATVHHAVENWKYATRVNQYSIPANLPPNVINFVDYRNKRR